MLAGAAAAGRPRDVGRELPGRARGRQARHGLARVPGRARRLARCRRAAQGQSPRRSPTAPDGARRSSTTAAAPPCSAATPWRRRRPAPTPCSTPWPTGRHADLASATLQLRPGRLVAQMAQPKGGPPPFALAGPEAVWYTAGARAPAAARPEGARRPRWSPSRPAGRVRAVVRHEPVTAWVARTPAGQDGVYEQLDGGRADRALPRDAAGRAPDGAGAAGRRPRRGRRPAQRGRGAHGERAARDARRAAAGRCSWPRRPRPRGRPTAPRSRASARAWRSGGASAPSAGSPTRSS